MRLRIADDPFVRTFHRRPGRYRKDGRVPAAAAKAGEGCSRGRPVVMLLPVETVRVYAPRSRQLLLLLLSVVFVAAGVWIIDASRSGFIGGIIGVLCIAFFGLAGIYRLVELVYRRPMLELDADGISDRASLASAGRLRWTEINAVTIYSVAGQRMLAVLPRDPNEVMARVGLVRRALMKMNTGFGFPPVNVPESAIPYSLEALVEEMRRHNPEPKTSAD